MLWLLDNLKPQLADAVPPKDATNPLAKLRGVLDGGVDDETFTKMVQEFS